MERLTFEGNFCDIAQCTSVPGGSFCENGTCSPKETWERLKAIENVLGDEYELERLKEMVEAEKEGWLVVPPCKVGDTVWIKEDRFPAEIECISITKGGVDFKYVEHERSPELTEVWDDGTFEIEDIGKTVFLTREAAEAALAKGAKK